MDNLAHWSRLKGFFDLSIAQRRKVLLTLPSLIEEEDFLLIDQGLTLPDADRMSENVVATFSLPFAIAANFVIDDEPVLVPMVTEEPSIVAACSKMAKLVSRSGGFYTEIDRAIIKGQIQLYHLRDIDKAVTDFKLHKQELIAFAASLCPRMQERGGGVIDMHMRVLPSEKMGPMLLIEPLIDVVDAMGANTVNTVLEGLAKKVALIFDGTIGLTILSNLSEKRLAKAHCQLSIKDLAIGPGYDDGLGVAEKIMAAHALAEVDIYRACTHNKGILNGIDAVALAMGNDFRAIEAGAHAYAALNGSYRPLTSMYLDRPRGLLCAELTLPLAVGVVGGISAMHQGVKFSHKILQGFAKTSKGLASVMVSAGLSQCLAALLALCNGGIQKGHMKLHRKKLMNQE